MPGRFSIVRMSEKLDMTLEETFAKLRRHPIRSSRSSLSLFNTDTTSTSKKLGSCRARPSPGKGTARHRGSPAEQLPMLLWKRGQCRTAGGEAAVPVPKNYGCLSKSWWYRKRNRNRSESAAFPLRRSSACWSSQPSAYEQHQDCSIAIGRDPKHDVTIAGTVAGTAGDLSASEGGDLAPWPAGGRRECALAPLGGDVERGRNQRAST